jgi:hypothetical protein
MPTDVFSQSIQSLLSFIFRKIEQGTTPAANSPSGKDAFTILYLKTERFKHARLSD